MSNSLNDLNAHLFDQLARLSSATLTAEQLETEAKRAEAMVSIADQINRGADLRIKAAKLFAEHGSDVLHMLPQIGKAHE